MRLIIFWSKHFYQYRTFSVCPDGFQGLSKAFYDHVQLLTFYLLLRNYLGTILKMLLKPYSEFPSLWLVDVLYCRPLIGWRKCERINLSEAASGFWFFPQCRGWRGGGTESTLFWSNDDIWTRSSTTGRTGSSTSCARTCPCRMWPSPWPGARKPSVSASGNNFRILGYL